MAKKQSTKKAKTTKKSTKKTASKAAKVTKSTPKVTKKTAAKKASTAKSTTKKTTKKKVTKKAPAKTTAKKTTKKTTAKKTTKKKASKAKTSTKKAAATKPAIEKPKKTKKIKNPLTKRELKAYRTLLSEKRRELLGDIDGMFAEAIHADDADLSNMPLHMADVGSDNYEQELTLGLVESERRMLKEIEEALVRIQEGTYGMCEHTGVPISKPRLEAKPWAKYCIDAARELEKTRRRYR